MASTQRRYSKEEFARRGDALIESKVRPHLTRQLVAIHYCNQSAAEKMD
jgi:hypothetical protein